MMRKEISEQTRQRLHLGDDFGGAASATMGPTISMSVRRSIRSPLEDAVIAQAAAEAAEKAETGAPVNEDAAYHTIIAEAKRSVGHGGMEGAFPEEWDAQLLVDCGRTTNGHRVVIFCPAFLKPIMDDSDELDRAFRFILLTMDGIAMREKYIFIYCYLGLDWSDPRIAHRLRFAYDYLPRKYSKNLQSFYILHPTSGFKVTMWTFWAWLSKRLWDKMEYITELDELCARMQPDVQARAELRRRFPHIVQCNDAEMRGLPPPVTFGVPLRQLCSSLGVDFTDKTTGRWYPKLPPVVIFLCEAMEREAADEDFSNMFCVEATDVYKLVETIDQGRPLDREIPMNALWCAVKLFLDCLPNPLLSFQAIVEIQTRGIKRTDVSAQRKFLVDTFTKQLPTESAYVALYMASFLHTMCENAAEREAASIQEEDNYTNVLTPKAAARVFAPAFIRPKAMAQESWEVVEIAIAVVETLINCAEEPELWIGRHTAPRWERSDPIDTDESSADGGAPAAGSKDNYGGGVTNTIALSA